MDHAAFNADDYHDLTLPVFIGQRRPLYSDVAPPETLFLKLQGHRSKPEVFGSVIFGTFSEGPPRHTHGGMIAYVLDEAMGSVAWHAGKKVVAETIEVKFRKLIPLFCTLYVKAVVIRTIRHNVYVKAEILDEKNNVYSYSRGRFRILSHEKLASLVQRVP